MEKMTPKERVLAALSHKQPDRVPFSLGFGINLPARLSLMKYYGMSSISELSRFLDGLEDIKRVAPDYTGPAFRNITYSDNTSTDIWGVIRSAVGYGQGSYDEISYYPLGKAETIADLDSHIWPSADWWDHALIKNKIAAVNKEKKYAVLSGVANIFETSWYMRGFEQMFSDLVLEPELSWEILTRVTDYFIMYYKKLLDHASGEIDIIFTADDIGHQEGLLMSPPLWEKMIKPHHERLNKVLHEYGVKIMYHTDGAIMELIPGLIDMGVDILEALQFDAKNMDPNKLKYQYGDKLCFHGGISVQKTLPSGTVCEVIREVKERKAVLGHNGGYILAPSHAIQAGTPAENIAAFLTEALK